MSMNELFNENTERTNGTKELSGTAQLTAIATSLANDVIRSMEADIENYREKLIASRSNHGAMDDLLEELCDYDSADADFLMELEDATIDGMLKSQQSKRSRAKGKIMTLDNYRAMMIGAIAENLIRKVTGKAKIASYHRRDSYVDYTPAQLEELAADQEKLRKEIRNIQSKKSILKSKAGFDESDERWQFLLKAEMMLKELRVGAAPEVIEVDKTKDALAELLDGQDIDSLKAHDSKELLEKIKGMLG